MADHTTISVSKNLKRDMDERRTDDESWNDYLKRLHGQESAAEMTVTVEDMRPMIHEEIVTVVGNEAGVNEAALAEALADYLINGENLPRRVADELGGGRR